MEKCWQIISKRYEILQNSNKYMFFKILGNIENMRVLIDGDQLANKVS